MQLIWYTITYSWHSYMRQIILSNNNNSINILNSRCFYCITNVSIKRKKEDKDVVAALMQLHCVFNSEQTLVFIMRDHCIMSWDEDRVILDDDVRRETARTAGTAIIISTSIQISHVVCHEMSCKDRAHKTRQDRVE